MVKQSKFIEGFITDDGYAAVPYGNQLIVIFNGEQLQLCRTASSAHNFIKKHRTSPQTGTVFVN
jgi:hypothetical protein